MNQMRHSVPAYISILVFILALVMAGCSSHMSTADNMNSNPPYPEMKLMAGQEVYACNCGAACPCDTLSMTPGKCTCGREMVKAKVISVGDGTATLMVSGEKRVFKTRGKYACNCGPKCPCHTISQNPGKCTCGVDMVKVKS